MKKTLQRIFHMRGQAGTIEDAQNPKVSAQKLEEAEQWTAAKIGEVEAIKIELARYQLELQLETGKNGRGARRQPH